ncbi:hypothetical protein Pmani_011954 [Petrolisthes manimaculis]|uniref:Uncharacterized protein n=1 Tax=Petrolisthes manimaculis TaxID=1843537 RepID=A0AAE1Q1H6_9EUCA|nr:hypothetical protein Pmani_011954 [Petrolisthes manimaculis]
MQGTMKKMPGPLAPPLSRRPRRKMTARSYSCTTYRKDEWVRTIHQGQTQTRPTKTPRPGSRRRSPDVCGGVTACLSLITSCQKSLLFMNHFTQFASIHYLCNFIYSVS